MDNNHLKRLKSPNKANMESEIMKKHVICLFEENGMSAADWARVGYEVFCYDILHEERSTVVCGLGNIHFEPWDAMDKSEIQRVIDSHRGHAAFLLAYPPCTDLAVSGAAWFASKAERNPDYRKEAMGMVYAGRDIGDALGVPYAIENPVSVISSQWRKPNHIFHPYEYGGYLPENDVHPKWPDYIAPRDAYPKKTCYWTDEGFVMPERKPVAPEPGHSRQHTQLGGKSAKTKSIRSASPRGVSRAIFEYNCPEYSSDVALEGAA